MVLVSKTYLIILFACGFSLLTSTLDPPTLAASMEITADTIKWERPRFSERQNERDRLVKNGIEQLGVTDAKVLVAMRAVPRHLFVPEIYQEYAYENVPLPIGHNQTISQPYIVAYMTEMLNITAGDKVLEIGTGSGYQAAVLSELTPYVFTIEIVESLGKEAIARFDKLGYQTIKTKIGDGYKGWAEHAPFDAILLTAAPEEIPKPLIQQLKAGGILVAPLGSPREPQVLSKLTKSEDGEVSIQERLPVRFVPMTGKADSEN